MSQHWSEKIITELHPCTEAAEWMKTQPSKAAAWRNCKRGDWLLWYAGKLCKTVSQRKRLVLAACACARLSLQYVPKGESRPLHAIQTAEAWTKGEATLDEVRAAYAAAAAARQDMQLDCAKAVRKIYKTCPR